MIHIPFLIKAWYIIPLPEKEDSQKGLNDIEYRIVRALMPSFCLLHIRDHNIITEPYTVAYHGFPKVLADFGQDAGVVVVGDSLDHGPGTLLRVGTLEYPRAHKHSVHPQLHQ